MTVMTTETIIRKKTTSEPGNPGEFGTHNRAEAAIELDVRTGDTFAPLSADESKVQVEDALLQIDQALMVEEADQLSPEASVAAGRALAFAEIASFTLDLDDDGGFERAAENLIDARKNGRFIEDSDLWDGPGELDAVRRQQIVTHLRTRGQEMNDAAETATGDAQAFYFARAEVFEDAALDLSGASSYYTGE